MDCGTCGAKTAPDGYCIRCVPRPPLLRGPPGFLPPRPGLDGGQTALLFVTTFLVGFTTIVAAFLARVQQPLYATLPGALGVVALLALLVLPPLACAVFLQRTLLARNAGRAPLRQDAGDPPRS